MAYICPYARIYDYGGWSCKYIEEIKELKTLYSKTLLQPNCPNDILRNKYGDRVCWQGDTKKIEGDD